MIKNSICCLIILLGTLTAFAQPAAHSDFVYACPPCFRTCDTIQFTKAGICPECGMTLEKLSWAAWQVRLKEMRIQSKETSVCFYLQDGVEVLDFAGPLEVFLTAGFKVSIVSRTKNIIRSLDVLSIKPTYDINDAPPADVIVVFGGETRESVNDTTLISWIQKRSRTSTYTMSICTGAFILGKSGILDNLTATTYHTAIEALGKAAPKTKVLPNTRFVDNGKVITTAGVSAGIDGALHLVEKIRGRAAAKTVADLIEYDKWVPDQGLVVDAK